MFKLTILGDGGVGKTALVIQLCLDRFVETYDPTIEDSYRKRILLDGHATTLEIMDTAGQEDYAALREQWIRDGEGFLMVYSVTERGSFERTKEYYDQFVRVKDGEPFGLVLVGNKCDEEDRREVGPLEGERLAQSWGVPFFETSAKFDINTDFAFLQAARLTRDTHDEDSAPSARSSFDRGFDRAEQQRQGSYSSAQTDYSAAQGSVAGSSLLAGNSAAGNTAAGNSAGMSGAAGNNAVNSVAGGSSVAGSSVAGSSAAGSSSGATEGSDAAAAHGAKPPLLTQRSYESYYSTRGSYESTQRYARPRAAASGPQAGSFVDSDGGETIVARPRGKKKKAKCAIM